MCAHEPEGGVPGARGGQGRRSGDGLSHCESQAALFKGLSDPIRLRLLRVLQREELNVQELCQVLDLAQPRVSRHLSVLRSVGLVSDRREGTKVFYALSELPESLESFREYLEELGGTDHPDLERLEDILRSRTRFAQAFADQTAAEWDEIGRLLHSPPATMLSLANLAPRGLTLVDLGTGTGLLLPFLSALGDHVWAVDQSAEMLRRARQRCQDLRIRNVTFLHTSMEQLGAELPTCDGLLMHFVLHQVARPHALLRRLASFLKPRGRIVIVDRVQHQDEQAKTAFGSVWLGFSREQLERWVHDAALTAFMWHPLAETGAAQTSQFDAFIACAQNGEDSDARPAVPVGAARP